MISGGYILNIFAINALLTPSSLVMADLPGNCLPLFILPVLRGKSTVVEFFNTPQNGLRFYWSLERPAKPVQGTVGQGGIFPNISLCPALDGIFDGRFYRR